MSTVKRQYRQDVGRIHLGEARFDKSDAANTAINLTNVYAWPASIQRMHADALEGGLPAAKAVADLKQVAREGKTWLERESAKASLEGLRYRADGGAEYLRGLLNDEAQPAVEPKRDVAEVPPAPRQSATVADVNRFAGRETTDAAGSLAVLAVNRNNPLDVRTAAARALLNLASPGVAERAGSEWSGVCRELDVLARGAKDLDVVRKALP